MDIHKDAATQQGVFQVGAFLVESNLAESTGVFTFKLVCFHSYLPPAKDVLPLQHQFHLSIIVSYRNESKS